MSASGTGGGANTCTSCGAVNHAEMNFCKMCGRRLEKKLEGQTTAPKYGFNEGLPSPATVFSSNRAVPAGGTAPTPKITPGHQPAAAPPPVSKPVAAPPAPPKLPALAQDAYAATMAPMSADALHSALGSATTAPGNSSTPFSGLDDTASSSTLYQQAPPGRVATGEQFGRLVVVNRDGTDGQVFALRGEQVDVGRHEGDIVFENDRYLASRHARLERQGSQVVLRAFDQVNGVYVRLTGGYALRDRDMLIIGKQVMRFEYLTAEERQSHQAVQHGVALFGTPPRQPWARLCQIDTSGVVRDVYHLARPEVVIGREEGDMRFPGDEFMSRRHAIFSHREGQAQVADNGSSNGSYVKLVGERTLVPGDLVRMGDQLFRYERV